MQYSLKIHIWTITMVALVMGCSQRYRSQPTDRQALSEPGSILVIKTPRVYNTDQSIDREVTIYPEARIYTVNGAKVSFQRKVNILGQTQVFDADANVEFGIGTIGTLNPCWFGATGNDGSDDTEAFEKTLSIASESYHSINIFIPTGEYQISRTLEVESVTTTQKSINFLGESMSVSGIHGASLNWMGEAGASLMRVRNNIFCSIENLDLSAEPSHPLRHNIELRPIVYQMTFRNCSFSGAAGPGSANVNINSGNNIQVSEISFENCVFRGRLNESNVSLTEAAVIGGLANTKNFYFNNCSLGGYAVGAINIEVSDILHVENCTFSHNDVDIICLLCNTVAISNYSERSGAFFKSTVSSNLAFTTLIGNYFEGNPEDDFVIRDGAGSLNLINNNFGSSGGEDKINQIKWDTSKISHITSIGNFFKNFDNNINPFKNREDGQSHKEVFSEGDKVGENGQNVKKKMNEH